MASFGNPNNQGGGGGGGGSVSLFDINNFFKFSTNSPAQNPHFPSPSASYPPPGRLGFAHPLLYSSPSSPCFDLFSNGIIKDDLPLCLFLVRLISNLRRFKKLIQRFTEDLSLPSPVSLLEHYAPLVLLVASFTLLIRLLANEMLLHIFDVVSNRVRSEKLCANLDPVHYQFAQATQKTLNFPLFGRLIEVKFFPRKRNVGGENIFEKTYVMIFMRICNIGIEAI
ncbi:hypothetical protein V2J09_024378 [Rumex salicifolius]